MGWDGVYMACPNGKERIAEATRGYNWEDDHRKVKLLDAALVGTTVYAAIEVITKATGRRDVRASVVPTAYDKRDKCFLTKHIGEESGPVEQKCPKRILDMLTPIDSQWANDWREGCRKYHEEQAKRRKLSAGRLPVGTKIRLHNPDATELRVLQNPHTNRKEFVGFGCHASTRCVNSWGWDVIEEASK